MDTQFHTDLEAGIAERLRRRCDEQTHLRQAFPGGLGGVLAVDALLPVAKALLTTVVSNFGPTAEEFLTANKDTIERIISDKVFDMAIETLNALKAVPTPGV